MARQLLVGKVTHGCCVAQVLEQAGSDTGGFKLASASIAGKGVYGRLKFESGVHRVQRVPATESAGRVHTSAASVAVMPQADEVLPQRSLWDSDLQECFVGIPIRTLPIGWVNDP